MTSSAPYLNNYWMLIGTDGIYSYTFEHEKKPDCPVCGGQSMNVEVGKDWTMERLLEWLTETQKMCARLPIATLLVELTRLSFMSAAN